MAKGRVKPRSYAFALEIVQVAQALQARKEFVLSGQLLRAKREFIAKMSIAAKEARETMYWLRLLRDGGYLTPAMSEDLLKQCEELVRTAIVKTAQRQQKRPSGFYSALSTQH